nr:hypothetical protein [Bacteroidota bacterium]
MQQKLKRKQLTICIAIMSLLAIKVDAQIAMANFYFVDTLKYKGRIETMPDRQLRLTFYADSIPSEALFNIMYEKFKTMKPVVYALGNLVQNPIIIDSFTIKVHTQQIYEAGRLKLTNEALLTLRKEDFRVAFIRNCTNTKKELRSPLYNNENPVLMQVKNAKGHWIEVESFPIVNSCEEVSSFIPALTEYCILVRFYAGNFNTEIRFPGWYNSNVVNVNVDEAIVNPGVNIDGKHYHIKRAEALKY